MPSRAKTDSTITEPPRRVPSCTAARASTGSSAFGSAARHFADMDTLNEVISHITPEASVLVKGSRFMKMERVVQHLTGALAQGH